MKKVLIVMTVVVVLMLIWTPALAQKPTPTDPIKTEPPPTEPVETEPVVTEEPPVVVTEKPKDQPTKVWDDPDRSEFDKVKLPGSGFGPAERGESNLKGGWSLILLLLVLLLIGAIILVK